MSSCLSSRDRDYIICLGGAIGICETIIEGGRHEDINNDLGHALAHLQSALATLIAPATAHQAEEVKRYLKCSELKVMPLSASKAGEGYRIVSLNDLAELVNDDILGNCAFCSLDERGVKSCKKKKLLMRMGLGTTKRTECPFRP